MSDAEFKIMQNHTLYGRDVILNAQRLLGAADGSFIANAANIACYHHERWDGKGYPEGLSKANIPIVARLMSIADVYDALVTERVYKAPLSHEEAVNIILDGQGTQFDPVLVDVFKSVQDKFAHIHSQLHV